MDDLLTDQQRADQVRGWMRENGWYLVGGVALGLALLFGWREYQSYHATEAARASALYEEVVTAARGDNVSRAEEVEVQMTRDHGSSPYLDQARLILARMKLDHNSLDDAAKYLRKVADTGGSNELRLIGRLRLARVLEQQEKLPDALALLEVPKDSAFAPRFHEARGDLLVALGKPQEARTEYTEALKSTEPVLDKALVEAKLDDLGLGGEPAPPAADATKAAPGQPTAQPAAKPAANPAADKPAAGK